LNVPVGEEGSVEFGDLPGAEDDGYERTEWHLSLGRRWHV
jgi:hypothetical protein